MGRSRSEPEFLPFEETLERNVDHELAVFTARISEEINRRFRADPVRFYNPHAKQREFHENMARFRIWASGNRVGKTFALSIETGCGCLGFRPYLLDDDRHTLEIDPALVPDHARFVNGRGEPVRVPTTGLLVASGFDRGIADVVLPYMRTWFGPYIAREGKGTGGQIVELIFKNGSRLVFGSYDQDSKKFEGTSYDFVGFDEPPPRDHWIAIRRGLVDRVGRAWFAMTPIREPWVYDEIWMKAIEGHPEYAAIKASWYDNPWREEDDSFIDSLSEEEKQVRIYGNWVHLSGRIYKEFDRRTHVVDPFPIPDSWPRYQIVDPHGRRPFAVVYAAIDEADDIWIYNEWPEKWHHEMSGSGMDIDAYVSLFRSIESGSVVTYRIMDPAFGKQTQGANYMSFREEFALPGRDLYYDCSISNAIEEGHMAVKGLLRHDPAKPLSAMNHPRLRVFSTCRNTIWSLEHYVWREAKRSDLMGLEKPREIGKDFCDCLRYLAMSNPHYARPASWNRYGGNVGKYGRTG